MARKRRGRGEGGVNELPSGRWYAEVSLGFDANGKRVRRRVYADSKTEAQAELLKLQQLAARGCVPKPGTTTVGQTLDGWLEAMRPNWEPTSYRSQEQHVRIHLKPRVGGVRLSQLHAQHVQRLMTAMEKDGVSGAMRRHVAVTLRMALGHAVVMGMMPDNPAKRVPLPPKPRHRSAGLDPEQVAAFLEAAGGTRDYPLYVAAVDSGLRQGELLALTWRDVDFARNRVTVSKTLEETRGSLRAKAPKTDAGSRSVELSPFTMGVLADHRKAAMAAGQAAPDTPVFCGERSGRWQRKNPLYRRFRRTAEKAGLRFRFHDLRHATATLLLADGVDVKTVQGRLGHAAASITMDVYAHILERGQKAAANSMQNLLGGTAARKAAAEG